MTRPGQCVILVGGLGSRLGDLVADLPKPMLEVAGRPFLLHLMEEAARYGFTRFLLLAGYRAEVVCDYFASGSGRWPGNWQVEVLAEPEPLGTGGALRAAAGYLEEKFLLTNGDSICRFEWSQMARPFKHPQTQGRLALRPMPERGRYGRVEVDGDKIAAFIPSSNDEGPALINAGVYFLRKEVIKLIPPGPFSLEAGLWPELARQGLLEYYPAAEAYFIDIGLPEDLRRASRELPALSRAGELQ